MTISVTHTKHNNIANWTQADLNSQITLGNYPVGTVLADIVLPDDWNNPLTTSMATGKLVGRSTEGTGSFEEITLDPSLTLTGGVLAVTSSGIASVTGLNTDNSDPHNPVINLSVDGTTILGAGTPASPLQINGSTTGANFPHNTDIVDMTGTLTGITWVPLDISNRVLRNTGNGLSLDWQNRTLTGQSGNLLVNWVDAFTVQNNAIRMGTGWDFVLPSAAPSGYLIASSGTVNVGTPVTSLNMLSGDLTLAAGSNISLTPSGGNTITISASGASGESVTLNFDAITPGNCTSMTFTNGSLTGHTTL